MFRIQARHRCSGWFDLGGVFPSRQAAEARIKGFGPYASFEFRIAS